MVQGAAGPLLLLLDPLPFLKVVVECAELHTQTDFGEILIEGVARVRAVLPGFGLMHSGWLV